MDKTMDKTVAMMLEIEKNHVLYDRADKDYLFRLFCIQIQNYELFRV